MGARFANSSLVDMSLRLLTIPVTGAASLAIAALLIRDEGPEFYAAVTLLWSLTQLLPLSDLGLGAVVTNVVAASKDPTRDDAVRDTVVRCFRILLIAAATVSGIALLTSGLHIWSGALPIRIDKIDVNLAIFVMLSLTALSMPLSLWQRIALGLHMNRHIILLTSITTPLVLLIIWLARGIGSVWVIVAPALAGVLIVVFGSVFVSAGRGFPVFSMFRLSSPHSTYRGLPVWRSGAAMMIIMVCQPLVLQSDRLVLGWFALPQNVAEYSLLSQLYVPLLSVLSAGAASLWPRFAAARAGSGSDWTLFRSSVIRFSLVGVVFGFGLVVVGPSVLKVVAQGAIDVSEPTTLTFGLLLVVQSATMPAAMFLTSEAGLKLQAVAMLVMLAVKLPLSALLAPYGAFGPVAASAMAILLCQFLPLMIYCRQLARGKL